MTSTLYSLHSLVLKGSIQLAKYIVMQGLNDLCFEYNLLPVQAVPGDMCVVPVDFMMTINFILQPYFIFCFDIMKQDYEIIRNCS